MLSQMLSLKITNKFKSIHAARVCVYVCVCVMRSSRTSSSCDVYSTSTLRTLWARKVFCGTFYVPYFIHFHSLIHAAL